MFQIRRRPEWSIPERDVTPERLYLDRRSMLRTLGAGAIGGLFAGLIQAQEQEKQESRPVIPGLVKPSKTAGLYPAARNKAFADGGRPLTPERVAATYNNFYEFSTEKSVVSRRVDAFETRPWTVEITGLVKEPRRWDIDDLVAAMKLEERIYRFRCVEAWAMTVPWTGFPLADLVKMVEPKSEAKYVRFWTLADSKMMPGINEYKAWGYTFPYYEGLRLDEATNELSMLATGIYGHELTKQHGAPIRLIVPWKYGYKSIKSIVKIEFTKEKPPTFWNDLVPEEYDFLANVRPDIAHPRWSQATERLIDDGSRVPTRPYNGYETQVAALYA